MILPEVAFSLIVWGAILLVAAVFVYEAYIAIRV